MKAAAVFTIMIIPSLQLFAQYSSVDQLNHPIENELILYLFLGGGIAITLAIVFVFYSIVKQLLKEDTTVGAKNIALLLDKTHFLRLVIVLAIIASIILLSILGRITEGILSLMSAIIGYMLGGLERDIRSENQSDESI
ncbi:MAG: hypothetical protein KTR30_09105 [Saprospiraceae bacterium]|nr:hypothetical protein [Saprospiraceae bacterium]